MLLRRRVRRRTYRAAAFLNTLSSEGMIHLDQVPQVWGITGNLGGGKTLSAVSLAYWGMQRGYYVVSNVTLNIRNLSDDLGFDAGRLYHRFSFEDGDFDPFALPAGSPRGTRNGKRVLVIMDECAEWIDQYSSTNTNPKIKRFLSWLRHSSKRSQDVILIVQRLEYLNKNIRLLISKWLVVDDLRVWRLPVVRCTIPFMGGFCMQRVFDRNRRLVQGPLIVRKSYIGAFYNTAECLNSDGATILYEYQAPRIAELPALVHWVVWLLSLLSLFIASNIAHRRISRQVRAARQFVGRSYQAEGVKQTPSAVTLF